MSNPVYAPILGALGIVSAVALSGMFILFEYNSTLNEYQRFGSLNINPNTKFCKVSILNRYKNKIKL